MLQGLNYSPTLHVKVAEIKAFRRVNPSVKSAMLPILVARPWQNANELQACWDNISSATEKMRFGLDLDRHRYKYAGKQPANADFDKLFNHTDGFSNYYNKLSEIDGAIPVLRTMNGEFLFLNSQIDRAAELDRGLIMRIELGHTHDIEETIDQLSKRMENVIFVVDGGWCKNLLQREQRFSYTIKTISDRFQEPQVIASSSTFPRSFSEIGARGVFSIEERELFNRLVRRHNDVNIIYGDWASTRNSIEPTPMTPVQRIDLAGSSDWTSFRRRETEVGYHSIAKRVIADPAWAFVPACWGKDTIELTATESNGGISGTQVATEVRINMHLTSQAAFNGPLPTDDDVPYVDPF